MTLLLIAGSVGLILFAPLRLMVGFALLPSVGTHSPFSVGWLDELDSRLRPPGYLDRVGEWVELWPGTPIAQGSTLRLSGQRRLPAQHLVLTDGVDEIPFNAEADGTLVAEWKLVAPVRLRIAARFGGVLVTQADELTLKVVPDATPLVVLKGAPSTRELIPGQPQLLDYDALDDHGLRALHLVLQCGTKQERRPLAQLDGRTLLHHGTEQLSVSDRFISRCHLPMMVHIEATDDDPSKGGRPGLSATLTLIPPALGRVEALRATALRSQVDALVALWVKLRSASSTPEALRDEWASRVTSLRKAVQPNAEYSVPGLLARFIEGQSLRLERAWRTTATRQTQLVDVLLAVDSALQGQETQDAARIARALADVAEEARLAAKDVHGEAEARARLRLEAAVATLDVGGVHLRSLGTLGLDLGGLVRSELRRMARAERAQRFGDVSLVASHLAARLRRPVPSFASRGGGRGGGGVEAGGNGVEPLESRASKASQRFERLARELQQLTEDHDVELRSTERLTERPPIDEGDPLGDALKDLAQRARSAVAGLPEDARTPGSPEAEATEARSRAESFARLLEDADVRRAEQEGREALAQLRRAERELAEDPSMAPELRRAKSGLDAVLQSLAELSNEVERQRLQRWREPLRQAALREAELARRAGNLSGQGKGTDTELPPQALEQLERAERWMEQATDAMSDGDAARALELQRQAQQALEEMSRGHRAKPESPQDGAQAAGDDVADEGPVPEPEKADADAEFRRRVLEGLRSSGAGTSKEAVERYTEELLR